MSGSRAALVTGASGFVGRVLVDRLLERGHAVTALSRAHDPGLPRQVRVQVGDLATGNGLHPQVFENVELVFHCAGEIRDASIMRQVHVDGTRRLLSCLGSRGGSLPHWVHLSSVGAYGPPAVASEPRTVDENSPENPAGEYETTKTESDRLVRQYASDYGMPVTVLRPSIVIGAHMSNASVRAVIAIVERGWYFHVGSADAIANYVHVDDVADALLACASRPIARGHTFNLSSDCTWTALIDYVARCRGVSPPRVRLPERVVRAAVGAIGFVTPSPLTPTRVNALVGRTSYSIAKIEKLLGFRCSRPMPQALDDLMAAG